MPTIQKLEGEHRTIRSWLSDLDGMLDEPSAVKYSDFVGLLDRLVSELRSHFEFEEKAGLFEDITSKRPSADRKVTKLLRQHGELLDQFSRLLADGRSGTSIAAVTSRLRAAMAELREHEETETELVQDVLLTDLGGCD